MFGNILAAVLIIFCASTDECTFNDGVEQEKKE